MKREIYPVSLRIKSWFIKRESRIALLKYITKNTDMETIQERKQRIIQALDEYEELIYYCEDILQKLSQEPAE